MAFLSEHSNRAYASWDTLQKSKGEAQDGKSSESGKSKHKKGGGIVVLASGEEPDSKVVKAKARVTKVNLPALLRSKSGRSN